jgi:hypothetical protein
MCVVSVVSSRRRRVQAASQRRAVPAYRWEVTTPTTRASTRRCLAESPITPRRIWTLNKDPKTEQVQLQAPAPRLM